MVWIYQKNADAPADMQGEHCYDRIRFFRLFQPRWAFFSSHSLDVLAQNPPILLHTVAEETLCTVSGEAVITFST